MPVSRQFIDADTPMGANLIGGGATFRVWAPGARAVHVCGDFNGWGQKDPSTLLVKDPSGYWAGFIPGIDDGAHYKFWIEGEGGESYKRDPYARELTHPDTSPGTFIFPSCNCVVRDPSAYPWHDRDFRPPALKDLIIYQLHIGTFHGADASGRDFRSKRVARFLDVLFRMDYLCALGVNAIEPLPVAEYPTEFSMGYNGVDIFSPEMEYAVPAGEIGPYLDKLNELLVRRSMPTMEARHITSHADQLKALIDVCHVYGMAVIFDVVYNHAGGGFDRESIYFFDQDRDGDNNNSLFFTDRGWAGGLSFALWKKEVRQFLLDNANFFIDEYHVDGFRYDEISALVSMNADNGWGFCQDLTGTVRYAREDAAAQICEYWPMDPYALKSGNEGGAGFDATWSDGLRGSVRGVIAQASGGANAYVDLDPVAHSLYPRDMDKPWRSVECLENHDIVYKGHSGSARIPALADPLDSRSWYARSRSRAASGLLLTAPGIPMLFMGQEFLEDRLWSDDAHDNPDTLIRWDSLEQGDGTMSDYLRFTGDLVRLRRRHPALRGGRINVFHVHNDNRVIAFHRWMEGAGRDIVVVASLNEAALYDYCLGFPLWGRWLEVFNSDVYDNWVNPLSTGNSGGINAVGAPVHGLPCSSNIVIPANGILVFARDSGD